MVDAVVAQTVEHFLGKEEVGSSSLLNSSKNPRTIVRGFLLITYSLFPKKRGFLESNR